MTAHRWSAVAVAAASFVACSAARGGGPPVVDGPFVSGNLAVYVIHGPARPAPHGYLTLKEGLAAGTVRVHEVQQVNQLEVENSSDQDLFLQAGEIVKGGQQDRTLARDLIVSAHSGRVPIDAHCVEHGRWTQRGGESVALFQSSENSLATKELRRANLAGDQEGVWADVARTQQKLATTEPAVAMAAGTQHDNIATGRQASAGGRGGGGGGGAPDVTDSVLLPSAGDDTTVGANTSLQITLENKAVQGRATECLKRLPATGAAGADVVGYAFAVNGKLDGGDVYASHALLAKMYPKLLNAAALEAVIDHPAVGRRRRRRAGRRRRGRPEADRRQRPGPPAGRPAQRRRRHPVERRNRRAGDGQRAGARPRYGRPGPTARHGTRCCERRGSLTEPDDGPHRRPRRGRQPIDRAGGRVRDARHCRRRRAVPAPDVPDQVREQTAGRAGGTVAGLQASPGRDTARVWPDWLARVSIDGAGPCRPGAGAARVSREARAIVPRQSTA
jgi:hypothetical protein